MMLDHPDRGIPIHHAVCQLLHAGRITKTGGESTSRPRSLRIAHAGDIDYQQLGDSLGRKTAKQGRYASARVAMAITILIGIVFHCARDSNITNTGNTSRPLPIPTAQFFTPSLRFHAAHLIVGLLMLGYILFLPRYAPTDEAPYRPYHVGAMYWHFVDLVWIFVVAILYVAPHL